jgi:hypothetical protein
VRKCSGIARSSVPQGVAVEPALLANGGGVAQLGPEGLFVELPPKAIAHVDQLPEDGVVVGLDADGVLSATLRAGTLKLENPGRAPVRVRRVIVSGTPVSDCDPAANASASARALNRLAATR